MSMLLIQLSRSEFSLVCTAALHLMSSPEDCTQARRDCRCRRVSSLLMAILVEDLRGAAGIFVRDGAPCPLVTPLLLLLP